MVRGIEKSEGRASWDTHRGRERRRSPVSQKGRSPPAYNTLSLDQAPQINKQSPGDAWQKVVRDIEKSEVRPTCDTHRGRELQRSPVSWSGSSHPAQNTWGQASQIHCAFGNVFTNRPTEMRQGNIPPRMPSASPGRRPLKELPLDDDIANKYSPKFKNISRMPPWALQSIHEEKHFPSIEVKASDDPMRQGAAMPPAVFSTIRPKAQFHNAGTTITQAVAPVERRSGSAKQTQKSVLPPHITRLQHDYIITPTQFTPCPIENHVEADLVTPPAPSISFIKKTADMGFEISSYGGQAQYDVCDPSVSNNHVVGGSVRLLHNTWKPNQYNQQVWGKKASAALTTRSMTNATDGNFIHELSVAVAVDGNKNTKSTPKETNGVDLGEAKIEGSMAADLASICENSNDLTHSPTFSVQSIPSYDGNHIAEDVGSVQTPKPRPRVCIPPIAPFSVPMVMNQESSAVPAPIPWLSQMMTQAPPHMRARAKLGYGRYIDGDYKSVNPNAGAPVPEFDGSEWGFAQTRKSMVVAI